MRSGPGSEGAPRLPVAARAPFQLVLNVLLVVLAALAATACRDQPKPQVFVALDAGPRDVEPADCRTHRANLQTGEITRVAGPFARFEVDGGVGALREGAAETFRARVDGDAGATGPSAGIVLGHRAVALSGKRLTALDRGTGKVVWSRPSEATSLLGIPGELALASGPKVAIGYRGKTGDEVFRTALTADLQAPIVVDERLVVFRPREGSGKRRVVVLDPPLAKDTVAPRSPARKDLDLDAPLVGLFGARATPGDFFVVTTRELVRVRHGASTEGDGAVVWRKEVPFGALTTSRALTVLDLEELVYLAAYDDTRGSEAHVVAYEARGENASELRELFRVSLAAHTPPDGGGGCTREVALGRADKDLVVASLCGASSVVTLVDGRRGVVSRRLSHP